jgi:lauroyl/myristoyl acyltransferase
LNDTARQAAELAEARRRPAPAAMPPAPLRVRLKTSPPLRRLFPTPLVVRRATRSGEALWRESPSARADAIAAMSAIVGDEIGAAELARLAEQHLVEIEVERALFWQPWRPVRLDATSSARLRRAQADDRGVLVSVCHLGPAGPGHGVLASPRRTFYSTSAPWFFEQPSHDYWGRRVAHWQRGLYDRNQRALPSPRSFSVLAGLLREGELVLVQFDMPGSHRTRFLGKPVVMTTGTARLAFAADALVLPMRNRREGHRVWADVEEPLDPREFSDADALHDALAVVHERWILEAPAALEDPRRDGAWEEGASPAAWLLPGVRQSRDASAGRSPLR